jgi:hypothetical protein
MIEILNVDKYADSLFSMSHVLLFSSEGRHENSFSYRLSDENKKIRNLKISYFFRLSFLRIFS